MANTITFNMVKHQSVAGCAWDGLTDDLAGELYPDNERLRSAAWRQMERDLERFAFGEGTLPEHIAPDQFEDYLVYRAVYMAILTEQAIAKGSLNG
jgi:hypothetical protein